MSDGAGGGVPFPFTPERCKEPVHVLFDPVADKADQLREQVRAAAAPMLAWLNRAREAGFAVVVNFDANPAGTFTECRVQLVKHY